MKFKITFSSGGEVEETTLDGEWDDLHEYTQMLKDSCCTDIDWEVEQE